MLRRDEYAAVHATLFTACGRPTNEQMIATWWQLLRDIPVQTLKQAVYRWLAETDSGFPTPAALRKLAAEFEHGPLLGPDEAFLLVTRALQRHSPYYEPREFCLALPPLVRQAVESCGGPTWIADLDIADRTTYAAQFRRAYEAIAARANLARRLPESLRPRLADHAPAPAIARVAEALSLPAKVAAAAEGA